MALLPPALERLLTSAGAEREEAWASFVGEFTTLLLYVARSVSADRDEAMDAYTTLLEQLREEDYRRLRGYAADPRSKFTTWLVVVARRICFDDHRTRYGRARPADSHDATERRTLRRRLQELTGDPDDLSVVADNSGVAPDTQVETAELNESVQLALSLLEPADRLLLTLRFNDDLSAAEIAMIMRFPSQFHVYRRLNSVLATLRASLRRRGFETGVL